MNNTKISKNELKKLVPKYNDEGKRAVKALLREQYGIKNTCYVIDRMKKEPEFFYNDLEDRFEMNTNEASESVFMSMEELCSPMMSQPVKSIGQKSIDSRPAAMEKLVRELIGDRLLELSKYITIDSLAKTVIIDKTSLTTDGFNIMTH